MSSQTAADALHLVFVPFVAPGHINPMVDIARLFAAHGIKSTIITTPSNAILCRSSVEKNALFGLPIHFRTVELPGTLVGLPDGIENMADITHPDMAATLSGALVLTRDSIESVLRDIKPDCLVGDIFYPCLADLAYQLKIPRLEFHGGNSFHRCVEHCLMMYAPHKTVSSDSEPFMVPGLPDEIQMTRLQLPDWITTTGPLPEWANHLAAAKKNCYGTILNTFASLEPGYEDFSKNSLGVKSWSVGPVSLWSDKLCNLNFRSGRVAVDEYENINNWLDARTMGSVIYVCFGSLIKVPVAQFRELALGLESCGSPFILVVRKSVGSDGEENLPDGFEQRTKERGNGYIIHGWAPQLLILKHPAVGGFVTHCGWNSIIEGASYGVPMVTWPQSGEQFYNEKLVTDVLKIGVPVGMSQWSNWTTNSIPELIKRDKIHKAITILMNKGDDSEAIKQRAKEIANAANKAVNSNGTSQTNLMNLIDELKSLKHNAE